MHTLLRRGLRLAAGGASCSGRAIGSWTRKSRGRARAREAGPCHVAEKEEWPIEPRRFQGEEKGALSTRSVFRLTVLLSILFL